MEYMLAKNCMILTSTNAKKRTLVLHFELLFTLVSIATMNTMVSVEAFFKLDTPSAFMVQKMS